MTRVGIFIGLFFVITTIAFNNCSGEFEALDASRLVNSSSSQCLEKIRSSFKVSDFGPPSVCDEPANYHCDQRRFRPATKDGKAHAIECSNIAGIGEACITVDTYTFNTSQQRRTASAEDLVEGGAYNRDEVTCINTKITSQRVALIQDEGSNVTNALEKTVEQCRQRSML